MSVNLPGPGSHPLLPSASAFSALVPRCPWCQAGPGAAAVRDVPRSPWLRKAEAYFSSPPRAPGMGQQTAGETRLKGWSLCHQTVGTDSEKSLLSLKCSGLEAPWKFCSQLIGWSRSHSPEGTYHPPRHLCLTALPWGLRGQAQPLGPEGAGTAQPWGLRGETVSCPGGVSWGRPGKM